MREFLTEQSAICVKISRPKASFAKGDGARPLPHLPQRYDGVLKMSPDQIVVPGNMGNYYNRGNGRKAHWKRRGSVVWVWVQHQFEGFWLEVTDVQRVRATALTHTAHPRAVRSIAAWLKDL